MSLKEILTLLIACIGAGLGLINTFVSIRKAKIRLKIIPNWSINFDSTMVGIRIVNLSQFPIIIETVGFTVKGDKTLYPDLLISTVNSFPQEIVPRNNINLYYKLNLIADDNFRNVKKVVIHTADGRKFYGTSPALKQMITLKNLPAQIEQKLKNKTNN